VKSGSWQGLAEHRCGLWANLGLAGSGMRVASRIRVVLAQKISERWRRWRRWLGLGLPRRRRWPPARRRLRRGWRRLGQSLYGRDGDAQAGERAGTAGDADEADGASLQSVLPSRPAMEESSSSEYWPPERAIGEGMSSSP